MLGDFVYLYFSGSTEGDWSPVRGSRILSNFVYLYFSGSTEGDWSPVRGSRILSDSNVGGGSEDHSEELSPGEYTRSKSLDARPTTSPSLNR